MGLGFSYVQQKIFSQRLYNKLFNILTDPPFLTTGRGLGKILWNKNFQSGFFTWLWMQLYKLCANKLHSNSRLISHLWG